MADRYTHNYSINDELHDGYVNHTISYFENDSYWQGLYWNFYDDNGYCDWYKAFSNIQIPKGSTIISATLNLSVYYVDPAGWVETELHAAVGNDIPTDYSTFDALSPSNNYANIHLDPLTSEQIVQYDVREIIQEKIDQDTWELGNNIIFFTNNTSGETSDSGVDWDTVEYNPYTQLIVTFEIPEVTPLTEILGGSRYEGFKYEHLVLDGGLYKHNGYLENIQNGNIKVDFTRKIIGSAVFDMKDSSDINFLSDLIRPYYWTVYDGVTYEFPLGTYMLSSPKRHSDGKMLSRNVQGYDLLKALEDDKTTTSTYYSAGTNVYDTICDILDNVGTWVKYAIEPSDEILVEDMSYELGRSKLFIINSLLNTINYYPLWCNGMGTYRSIPWSDKKHVTWTFEDNNYSLYESGIDQDIDYSDIYNRVIIVARQLTEDTEPLYKVWTFEDEDLEDHPLSYTQLGRYITKKFDSEAVNQSYVDLRARREILKMLEIEEAIEYKHAFVTSRLVDGLPNQGDCFRFKNSLLDVNEIYKIESHDYKLKVGELVKSSIRRVTSV